MLYHLAAAFGRRQLVEPSLFAVEHAQTRRTIHLVGRADKEIAVQCLQVDGHMRCGLRAVDTHGHTMCVRNPDNLLHGVDNPQHIAHLRHGDEAGTRGYHLLQTADIQHFTMHGNHFESRLFAAAEHLPRYNVRVVLQCAHDDFISLTHKRLAKGESEHVEGVGSAFGEDDFFGRPRVQEVRHGLARPLVVLRRYLAQVVHTAVDVRIPMGVRLHDGVQHHLRLLARRRVIQIYQALAVHLFAQYGKIGVQSGK